MAEIDYVLGHSDPELHRLEIQAAMFAPSTERMLRAAGLEPQMSVLDIGTGAGDVAMLVADLVGPAGSVVSIDREEKALERARSRAHAAGLAARIRFEAASLEAWPQPREFDFVVGRSVLSWQADQAAFLASAAKCVRPGGTLLFIEPGFINIFDDVEKGRWSNPPVPLYDEMAHHLLRAFEIVGYRMETGANFVGLFHEAGLPEPTMLLEQIVGGPNSLLVEHLCLTLQSFMPALDQRKMARPGEIDFSTLQERLQSATAVSRSQLWTTKMVAGWARVG